MSRYVDQVDGPVGARLLTEDPNLFGENQLAFSTKAGEVVLCGTRQQLALFASSCMAALSDDPYPEVTAALVGPDLTDSEPF